ncbi:hypothetical protein AN216_03555 [Streptomyces oceani]|uniref:Uncharacterized protein n=1 Tax=Streptomyces oceani TaxID=1075402 RepID=A0A1E7KMV4_9ACTN|nr:hypothetical protein [Streptomyces oceani]OEV05302.1 hypothetical protein AN216_03555 [Streptomyces oceani]
MSDKRNTPQDPSGQSSDGGSTAAHIQQVEELERQSNTAARLFDVRRIIGGLFVVYGVIVTFAGITASEADLEKAQDININLWTGLGMLALGIAFLVWLRLSPAVPPPPPEELVDGQGPEGSAGSEGSAGPEEPKGPAGSAGPESREP